MKQRQESSLIFENDREWIFLSFWSSRRRNHFSFSRTKKKGIFLSFCRSRRTNRFSFSENLTWASLPYHAPQTRSDSGTRLSHSPTCIPIQTTVEENTSPTSGEGKKQEKISSLSLSHWEESASFWYTNTHTHRGISYLSQKASTSISLILLWCGIWVKTSQLPQIAGATFDRSVDPPSARPRNHAKNSEIARVNGTAVEPGLDCDPGLQEHSGFEISFLLFAAQENSFSGRKKAERMKAFIWNENFTFQYQTRISFWEKKWSGK